MTLRTVRATKKKVCNTNRKASLPVLLLFSEAKLQEEGLAWEKQHVEWPPASAKIVCSLPASDRV